MPEGPSRGQRGISQIYDKQGRLTTKPEPNSYTGQQRIIYGTHVTVPRYPNSRLPRKKLDPRTP